MARPDLARTIVDRIGRDVADMVDEGTGWPALVDVRTSLAATRVALHVSMTSTHARRGYERRFQNPASAAPVLDPAGAVPILVGYDTETGSPLLVAVDGSSRVGRPTRFSILFNKRVTLEASQRGWSEYRSASGELIVAMQPRLFPLFIELVSGGVFVPPEPIANAAVAAGLTQEDAPETGERARRMAASYVRDARFSRIVRAAYEHRCALCGLALDLVAGAHIYPVSAPGAQDRVWNGIALCHNHHAAFDGHHLWIDADYFVRVQPTYRVSATGNAESERFLQATREQLWVPRRADQRPRPDMLAARYDYYGDEYAWAPRFRRP